MRPPASWTARVTRRCAGTCAKLDITPAIGSSQPRRFGAMPPVTISPAPPAARSA